LFDRHLAALEAFAQVLRVESYIKRLDAELLKQGVLLDEAVFGWMPKHSTKASWIVQSQGKVLKMPFNMVVFSQYFALLDAA
jgi:hypothetical protein